MIRFEHPCPESGWGPFVEWMERQGIDMGAVIIDLLDEGTAVMVTSFARDDNGERIIDHETDTIVRAEPVRVPITELPPRRPLVDA